MEAELTQDQHENPFYLRNTVINQLLMLVGLVVGIYAVKKYKPRKLPVCIALSATFFTVGRYFTCARCQYCGQPCATMMGVMAARVMPKNESKVLSRNNIVFDFILLYAFVFSVLPQTLKSRKIALLFMASLLGCMGSLLCNSCGKCGNDFCPMKDLRKAILKTRE